MLPFMPPYPFDQKISIQPIMTEQQSGNPHSFDFITTKPGNYCITIQTNVSNNPMTGHLRVLQFDPTVPQQDPGQKIGTSCQMLECDTQSINVLWVSSHRKA
jgi:hypothetical protein